MYRRAKKSLPAPDFRVPPGRRNTPAEARYICINSEL